VDGCAADRSHPAPYPFGWGHYFKGPNFDVNVDGGADRADVLMTGNNVAAVESMGRLTEAQFERFGRAFADATTWDDLTWAWVSPRQCGAFAAPVLGYLTSSQLLVWPPPRQHGAGQPESTSDCIERLPAEPEDAASLSPGSETRGAPDALCLHICLSQTFGTPMLLLLGSGAADGRAWGTAEAQSYVRRCAGANAACLPPNIITQAEHPVLGGPCCALHPCRTAEVLQLMLSAHATGCAAQAELPQPRLDPLCAWWSLVSPLVGARAAVGTASGESAMSTRAKTALRLNLAGVVPACGYPREGETVLAVRGRGGRDPSLYCGGAGTRYRA
jgi:ubiquitin-like-conjugating enzyme ATG10